MEPIELTPVRDTLHLAPSIAPKIALPTLTDLTTKIPTPAELLQGINTPQEKVEKDPYKLAEEAYFKKKKPKIDTSSSIAPTETITPEEYKGFNKDDTISSSVKYDQNYEANKRATQTDGERWLNTAQKFGANATSMFLGGLSTIPNILGSVTNGIGYLAGQETPISEYFNMAPDSGVMKDLFEWSDAVNKDNRNYQSNWSKENWIQDLVPFFGDGGFQDIVASAGYTAGAIGEALVSGGIASILSKGTKLAGMGAKLSKYLNDPAKIDKVLNAISATKNSKAAQLIGDAGYLMGKSIENSPQLYRAYVGAHVEAAFEGLEGAKRFEEDVVNEYKKNHGGVAPDEKELAKIKDLAQNVGDLRYKLNLLTLTIPNYIQMGALLKTFPGASKVAKTLLGKNELGSVQLGDELGTFKVNAVNDIKFNTTNALWDKRIPKAFKNGVEKTLSYGQKFGKIPLSVSEGLEEEMQYFIDEHTTSLYKGAYLNEKGLEENSLYLSGLWDTIQNKLATKEATQAFLMGSMGGGIQQSMNTVYEAVFDKNKLKEKIAQNELYAKKLEDISGSLFKSSDVFNVATDEERVQLENYLSKALDQNSLNGTLQENYQKVLASLNTNAATNVAIQKNFLGAQRIYQDLQDRDVSGLLHSVVSSGKQEVFKEHLNSIANATEEEIQNLYGININEQTRDNKQFAKNLIDKLNKIEGYSKKISFAFNDTFDNETDNQFYSMYKQQLSHNLYMMNRKQERIGELSTPNSALFLDLLQDKKQSINDKIEELKTATSLVPIKDATKRIALLEQLKDGSNVSLKDAIYAYSGESVAELEAVAEFEKANDALILKEGRSGIDNLRKYYEELYSTDGFELFKDQHKDYYDAIKAVREFQQKSADRKVRNEKQYTQLQKDLLVKDDGENIKKAVQKLSEDISNVEDDEKLTKEQKESKKQFLINEAKQKIANLRNSKPVETVEKKTPKTETTKETEVVETPAVEVKDVVVEEITTDVAQKFSEAPIVKQATKKETKTNLSSFLAILRNKKLDEITKAEDWIDSKGLSVFQEKRKEYFKKRSSYNSDLKGFLGELETARAIELHKDTAHKNSFFSFYKDKSSISKNSIEMYGETRAEIELALAVDEIVELYKKLNETTKEEDLKDVSIDDFDEEVPAVSNDLQSKIKEVRLAIKKAGQGEGGQFFVTLTDGTKLGAVRLGVVGDTLQTSDGEIDFSIITKIENPDGTVLYDSNPSPLIDEKTVERKIQLELKDAKSLEVNQIDFNANILSINAEQQQRISESERNNYTAHFLGSVVGKVQTVKRFVEAEKAGKTIPKGFDSWNKRAKETLEEANRTYKTLIESYIKKDMHTEDELIKEIGVLLKGKNVNQRNVAPVVVDVKADIERRRQEANNKNEEFWEQFTAINAEEVADRDNLINKLIKDIPLPANTRINNWVLEELNGKLWEGKNIRGKEEEFFGKENWDKIKEAKKQFDIEFKKIEDSNLAKIKLIEQKQSALLSTVDGVELRRAWSLGLIEEPNIVGLDETNFISKETDNYEGYYYLSKPDKDGEWYEQIIGKTEKEVENKINAKYDAEQSLKETTKAETTSTTNDDNSIEAKKADIERRRPTSYIRDSKDKKSPLETFRNEAKREWDGVSVITGDRMKNLYVGIQLFVEAYPEHKDLLDKFIKKENGTIGITNNNLSFVLNTLKKQGVTTESELGVKINAKYDAELKALEKTNSDTEAKKAEIERRRQEGTNARGTTYKGETTEKDRLKVTKYSEFRSDGKRISKGGRIMTPEEFIEEYNITDQDFLDSLEEATEIRIYEVRVGEGGRSGISIQGTFPEGNIEMEVTGTELAALESPQQSNEESKKADIERRRQETLLKELFEKPETESDYFGKKIFEGDKIGDKGFEIQINSRIFIGRIDVSIKYLKYVKSQKYYYEGAKQYARDTKESIIKDFNSINEALNYAINLLNDEDKQLALKINAKYDEELAALETPVVNLPFDNTNLLGALSTENTIPEILLTEAQGLKILQPEYYLALDVLDRDEAKANLQRRKELLNSVTNLSEIPTTVREVAYPAKSINKTEQIYGDVFIKLGGGKLYHLIHTNPETGQETILYEFRSLKHGFGLQKTWVDTSYPRIVEELKNTDGLLETTGKDGFTNKPFFFGDFSSYYSLYDVWNLMNEDERSDFLHKFNIRADQMQEAFDTQNVFEKLLASPSEKYELNRILDGWVDAHRGTEVSSYAVDFKTQTTIDTLPQSKFIDAETGNQHHVVVYADFDLLYDGEGNLKTETEYKIAKQKVVDGMQVRVDAGNNTSRITNYILDNLIQQLDSEVLEPVHFLSSGYNLVLSDTNGKPYIKSLFPSTDLKGNEVLNKNLHALVESADWNGKSTREAGFHILLNNLSNKVGYSVEVSNVKFNFYTKQDGKQVRSIAVSLEWVDKDTKKSKTLHISLKENLTEEGRYEKNIKEISDGLIKQVEKEFGVTGISAKFVAAEAKEPVDVPTILKNNNSVELGVFWNRNDFRKDTPVLFNSDRVIPRIVEEYEQELKEESSVALPVVSTKIEEAKTKTAAPIEQSDIPPIQAMVNKHVGEKGMILQKDENITSEKALLFGADVVKIMEQSKDAEQMLNEMLEDSKTISENETHSDIKSILSLLYFNPKFESLRPYFNTQPKPIDSNCVLTQN